MNYQDIKLALYRVETLAIDGLVTEAHALVEDIRNQGMAAMDYKHIVSAEARKLIREHKATVDFQVGDGATICLWSDRHAATVIKRPSPKTVVVQRDKATVTSGSPYDGTAEYSYSEDPEGGQQVFTFRKNGQWIARGRKPQHGPSLATGRHENFDPHF